MVSLTSKPMEHRVMRALIVDDEPIARRILREELELFPEVRLVGEAGDGKESFATDSEIAARYRFSRSANGGNERV